MIRALANAEIEFRAEFAGGAVAKALWVVRTDAASAAGA